MDGGSRRAFLEALAAIFDLDSLSFYILHSCVSG